MAKINILFSLPDGSIWKLEAGHVANVRAKYYARLDLGRGDSSTFAVI